MVKDYRFVGLECSIGGRQYDRFGMRAQFDLSLAQDVLSGGACFIPDSDYLALGISDADAQRYGYAGGFPEPPQTFRNARAAAQARARELMSDITLLHAYHDAAQQA